MHKTLSHESWRAINGPTTCPEVFRRFRMYRVDGIAKITAPPTLIHVHTKEDVMLPPEQTLKYTTTKQLVAELSGRFGGFLEAFEPLLEMAKERLLELPVKNAGKATPPSPPKVVDTKIRKYKLAIIGPMPDQFQRIQKQVEELSQLNDMFELVYYDKDAAHLNLEVSTNYVLETRHISHKVEEQAASQLGGKDRIKFCSIGQLLQEFWNLRSRIIAETNRK